MSAYASDLFTRAAVTNTINLFLRKKKVLWVGLGPGFYISYMENKRAQKCLSMKPKIAEIWNEQIRQV